MKKRDSLELLIELQRHARDESARNAARSRRDSAAADSTLRMLQDYGSEHAARAPDTATPAFAPASLRIRDAFGQRLQQAIGEQDTVAHRLGEALADKERALLDGQRRLKALETLAQRRSAAARQRASAREQGRTDEFALQSFLRGRKETKR